RPANAPPRRVLVGREGNTVPVGPARLRSGYETLPGQIYAILRTLFRASTIGGDGGGRSQASPKLQGVSAPDARRPARMPNHRPESARAAAPNDMARQALTPASLTRSERSA